MFKKLFIVLGLCISIFLIAYYSSKSDSLNLRLICVLIIFILAFVAKKMLGIKK